MSLALAVEANMAEWVLAKAACVDGVDVHRDEDVSWTFTRMPAPENTVVLARFSEATVEARVAAILRHHLQHKAACNWITGPASKPATLGTALRKAGFHCRIHCAGMACSLAQVPPSVPVAGGLQVSNVHRAPSFEPLTTERRRRTQAMRDGLTAQEPRRAWHFAASLDGEPAGRTTLFVSDGVAGVYDVEVLRPARNRGVGTALVHAALQHAFRLGLQHAVLSATGAGFNLYQRLGFREVTRISFWRYGAMRQLRAL